MSFRVSLINKCSLICGAICAAGYIFTVSICNSPIDFMHKINKSEILPPIWLFIILSTAFCFLMGIAAGAVIYATASRLNIGDYERSAYKGGLFFLSAYYLFLAWYPVIFGGEHLFIAIGIMSLCLVSSLICALCWFNSYPTFSPIFVLLFSCWCVYILIAIIIIFFNN